MTCLLFLLVLISPHQQSDGLLESVNRERGGRHWIDQKPDPPKTPEDSQACFQIEPGSRLELVAAEPIVIDPVWIDFDHKGRMFVAEYTDYPIGPVKVDGTEDTAARPLSKIVLLEDTDADGQMDRRTVFADGLNFCHSFTPLMGGILAGAQTEIIFLKDTDGDNVADVREVWFDGFQPAHPQMQIGCPQWGMDNWIYLTYAPGQVRCRRPGFESAIAVTLPRQDMRFDPLTMKFEAVSGLGQFGNTIDNHGNRYFSTNRNPIMMEMISESAGKRNPYSSVSVRHTDVGPSGGDTRVYPLVEMKSNWLAHAGTHTSACGVTAYRGGLWGDGFHQSVFACEPVGHLVTRSVVSQLPNSPALTAVRARENADFLASSDTWFRPSSLRTGPDGALYLADMYRMWVEHPKFLPPEIAAQIDWRAGDDKGRIWRIVPDEVKGDDAQTNTRFERPDAEQTRLLDNYSEPQTDSQLVEMLSDTNGWRRKTAQRMLVELASDTSNQERVSDIAVSLRALVTSAESHFARFHALHVLDGIDCLLEADLLTASRDEHWLVREAVVRLAVPRMADSVQLRSAVIALADANNVRVQFAALQSFAEIPPEEMHDSPAFAGSPLWDDRWFQAAALSTAHRQGQFLIHVLQLRSKVDPDLSSEVVSSSVGSSIISSVKGYTNFVTDLSTAIAAKGDPIEVGELLEYAADAETSSADVAAVVLGFEKGAKRNKGALKYRSMQDLVSMPDVACYTNAVAVQARVLKVSAKAFDKTASNDVRSAAMRLLVTVKSEDFVQSLPGLLAATESQAIQQAAIGVVREFGIPEVLPGILASFQNLTPAARKDAASLMLQRPESTIELLSRMQSGGMSPSVIDIDQRLRLLENRNETIQSLAHEVFGGVVSMDRKAVADAYHAAISMPASRERGAVVFEKTCSNCHRIDGKGHQVGPDISDTRNRSRDALLYDILDPNRRVDPQFSEYLVVTTDGRSFNGLLISDSGDQIVLRQTEGKEQTIARTDIEELQATNKSLMPVGIEKDVTVQQMADLLEYLKAR